MRYEDRIREAMKRAGMDAAGLAREIGISYQAVKKVLDGKSGAFSTPNNAKAAQAMRVSADWLATGAGSMDAGHFSATLPALVGGGVGRTSSVSVLQAVIAIGLALESVDQIARDQAAPLLVALTKEPGRAQEFGGRLEVTLRAGNGGPSESGQRSGTHG